MMMQEKTWLKNSSSYQHSTASGEIWHYLQTQVTKTFKAKRCTYHHRQCTRGQNFFSPSRMGSRCKNQGKFKFWKKNRAQPKQIFFLAHSAVLQVTGLSSDSQNSPENLLHKLLFYGIVSNSFWALWLEGSIYQADSLRRTWSDLA